MRHVLSNIRLNHAQTNIIMTVGIAFSPALVRKKKPTPGRCKAPPLLFYIDQCDSVVEGKFISANSTKHLNEKGQYTYLKPIQKLIQMDHFVKYKL